MANGWGGYRQPSNPAVVSAPGAGSARTDGGVLNPNAPAYGEGAALEQMKSGAPLAGGGALAGAAQQPSAPVDPLAGATPFGAPSQAPGMPITAGAAQGAGPGPDVLGLPTDPAGERKMDFAALPPGMLQALIAATTRADATPSFRRLVRAAISAA